jgi:hypothetical protein
MREPKPWEIMLAVGLLAAFAWYVGTYHPINILDLR